jgi:hypothetical protein
MVRRITLEINLEGGTRTAGEVRSITEQFEALQAEMRSLEGVSNQLGTGIKETEALLNGLGLSAEQASQAITGLLLEQQGLRQAGETISNLGLSETQGDVLGNVLGNPEDIQQYINMLNGLDSSLDAVAEVARLTGGSIADAEEFIERLGLSAEQTARALKTVQAGQKVGADRGTQVNNLRSQGLNEEQSGAILDRVDGGLQRSDRGAGNLLTKIGLLSLGFNQTLQAVQTFAAGAAGAYDALIGQNEKLRQEVLSVQSSLVANTDVFRGGVQIEDPTEAILALEAPIKKALDSIRQDSLELVGVTSGDLTQVFSILTQQTQAISNQSATLGDPIEAASKLTIDFAATLGTLGVPLGMARQEIQSILTGQIDQNSILAKSLGITNAQVKDWQQQGVLVDKLRDRLEPFVAGNALAAKSVSGITSNLREVFEVVTREAGEGLYKDLVDNLQRAYDFITQNKDAIASGVDTAVSFLRELLDTVLEGIEGIAQKLTPLGQDIQATLGEVAVSGAESLLVAVELLFNAVNGILGVLQPLLNLLGQILQVMNDLGITEFIVQSGALYLAIQGLDVVLAAMASTLFTKVIPSVIATATAIAPLLPLLTAAAIAVAALNATKIGLGNETIDSYASSVKIAGDESFKYAQRLKELNQLEQENGALTAEQQKAKANLLEVSKSQIEQNEAQIKELKALKFENKEQENSQKSLITQLEISNNTLKKQAGLLEETADGVKVQSRALQELGGAYEQIQKKIDGNLEAITRGTGDIAQIQRQAKEAIELTQQQLEAGVITTEEAIANLKLIATNTKLTYEEQLSAQKGIFAALTKDVERVSATIKQAESDRLIDLQELLNAQLITETEYNQRKSELTTARIKAELEAESDRLQQIESLDLSPEEKQEEIKKAIAKTTELQLQLLQQEKAERESIVALVKEGEDLRVAAIKRETSAIVSNLKIQQDGYDKLNQALERQKTAQDVILRNLETENRLINSLAEVDQARRNLADVEGDTEADRLKKVIELRKKLNSGELKTDQERREVIFELQRLRGFNSRSEQDLAKDLARLEDARFKRQVEAQKAEEARARILLELELKKNEASAARAVNEAKIALNQAKQAELSALITANQSEDALAQAEGDLNTAIASGKQEDIANAQDKLRLATEEAKRTREAIPLTQEGVVLAANSVEEANRQVGVNAAIAQNSRLALDLQQQAANVQLVAEARARGQAAALKEGADQAERMAAALNSIKNSAFGTPNPERKSLGQNPGDIGVVNGRIVTVEGRFKGGAMEAGTPYVVGEGAGGRFLPGISEIIVPNTQSYAIASTKATEIFNQGQQSQIINNSYAAAPIVQSNQQLLDAVNGLRADLKTLETGSVTKIEGVQIVNQLTRADNRQEAMRFARDLADEIAKIGN